MKPITLSQFTKRYDIKQKIGSGSFGQVFRIEDIITKRQRALKKIRLRKNETLEQFLRQIQIQNFLAHPLVIQVNNLAIQIFEFYVFEAQNHYLGKKQEIGIVMELGKRSLLELIKDKNQHFPIQEIINFAFQFIKLFAYFQDQNIVHRDIKPQNFIQFGPGLQCKLIDFGLCSHINDIRALAGSFHYFSPKLKKLHYNPTLKLKTNHYKDDVYSFGLTLYELITRKIGHSTAKWGNSKYSRDVYHYTKNSDLTDIIEYMLEDDEDKRPDFIELFEIFNKKFTFYEDQHYLQKQKISQFSIQKSHNISTDESLTQQKREKMNKPFMNIEQIRRTYRQEVIFENGEYQFRTIKDGDKENFVNFQNNSINNQYEFESYQRYEYQRQRENQKLEVENNIRSQSQQISQQHQPQNSIPQQQKFDYERKNYHLGSKINIRSIIIIKEFIICGCQDGSLYVLNTQSEIKKSAYKIERMIHHHTNAITVMSKDSFGRLWTCSEDSKVLVWDRTKFFSHLMQESYYHEETIQCTNKKGQKYTQIHNYIEMDPLVNFPIKFPFENTSGVSSLYCINDSNYMVGFNDGLVYALWKGHGVHYAGHQLAVTAINIHENHLFTSSFDGTIRVLNLDETFLIEDFFAAQLHIQNFKVTGPLQNPNFLIVTADGRGYETTGWKITVNEQPNFIPMDITASMFINGFVFYIEKNGDFYRNGAIIQKCQGEGWNCMHWNSKDMMALGNSRGEVVSICAR